MGILPLTGCLIYNNDVSYGEKGKPVSAGTLDQIECGETSKAWVLATLGDPSQQNRTQDGVEILQYRYNRKKDNNFILLPFLIVNDEGESTQTVYFEINDGVVTKYWQETSRH